MKEGGERRDRHRDRLALDQVSAKRFHTGQLGFERTNDVVLVMTQRMFG
ncbi:MAG: hypothetical protein WB383_02670 [Acidimicrobiales bacterium]